MVRKGISLLLTCWFVLLTTFQSADAYTHNEGRYPPGQLSTNRGTGFFLDPGPEPENRYRMRTPSGSLWLAQDAIWLTQWTAQEKPLFKKQSGPVSAAGTIQGRQGVNIQITFPGANPDARLVAGQPLNGRVSFLVGSDPRQWTSDLPTWGEVRYQDLYPGVDLVIRSAASGFDWAYEARPGAETGDLRLRIQGADGLSASAAGARLQTGAGDLYLPPLRLVGGPLPRLQVARDPNSGVIELYPLAGAPALLLADTPAKLDYSTYLGGSSWETAYDVAIDATGAAYLVGETASANFPTTPGAFDATLTQTDVFAVKLLPHGAGLSYATFIGGSEQERAWSVAVESGVAYIGGETGSADFPVTSGSSTYAGNSDAFVTALNSTGTGLVYSRLLGGTDQDQGYAIAVQNSSAYLTGFTYSNNFPGEDYVGHGDVFVTRLNANGTVNYSRITGGNQEDAGFGIAVLNGAAWVTGETWSANFGSANRGEDDVFILSLNTAGAVSAVTSYGGTGEDYGSAIALDGSGNVYVAGTTASADFPFTEGALNGAYDAFLLRVSAANGQVGYAASLGGANDDQGKAIALDYSGGIVVAGATYSTNFPVTADAFQSTQQGSYDGFVTRFVLSGSDPGHRAYSSYLGGSGYDDITAVAVDPSSMTYLAGQTSSSNFPTTVDGPYQARNGTQDAFLSVMAVGPVPEISITTLVNLADANEPPGPLVRVGDTVTWQYDVHNTGALTLTNIHVSDDQGVSVTCPATSLAPGVGMRCTASGTATSGQHSNLGSVTATTPDGATIGSADASHYFGADPRIDLVKKTNGSDENTAPGIYLESGSPVTWTYEISNSGNVELTNVSVVDDNGTPGSAADDVTVCTLAQLVPGASDTTTCHLAGTAAAGAYANHATATGTAPAALGAVTDSDASHYFGSAPAITLVKTLNGSRVTAAPGPYVLEGSLITWGYEVHNTGNVTLSSVTVIDDAGTPATSADDATACSGITLIPGATTSCSLNGTAVSGAYHNTAAASGTPPVGANVSAQDESFYQGVQPAVSLEYAVNESPADSAPGLYVLSGSTLDLQYRVSNDGDVPLSHLVITENAATICTIESLAVGASATCERSLTAQLGQRSASASVTATPPGALQNVTASDPMHYFGAAPGLTLTLQTNNQDAAAPPGVYVLAGSTVTWTYRITNTGNVPLVHVSVVDDGGTPGSPADDQVPAGCGNITLNAGASATCTLSGLAQAGQYANTAVATGAPPEPLSAITASDTSHYFGAALGVSLLKQTNGVDAEAAPGPLVGVGAPVTWTYRVTNSSNVAVDFTLVDDNGTPALSGDDATVCGGHLAAGAQQTCVKNGTAAAGQYANTARVTVTPPGGLAPLTAQDTSHYFGVVPGVEIVKYTNGLDANQAPGPYIHVGDPVAWTYVITNTGNVPLSDVVVTDDQGVAVTCPAVSLQPDVSMTCTGSGVSTAGLYQNTGRVTARPPAGFDALSDSDASHYFGTSANVNIEKFTNGVDYAAPPGPYLLVGQSVTWTYAVTNTGNVPLNDITVTDDQGAVVSCPGDTLAPEARMDCTAAGTASTAGQYTNVGRVSARPAGETGYLYDSDASYYFGAAPEVQLVIRSNGLEANDPPGAYLPVNGALNLTYEVTNSGNIPLENVSVSGAAGPIPGCTWSDLPVDQVVTCTASVTALTGQQSTTGSASASAAHGLGEVNASDTSHYFGYQLGITLVKSTNGVHSSEAPGPELLVGLPVVWTYTVTNHSNVALGSVSVSDSRGVIVTCPKTALAVGESMTCSASGTAVEGQYSNVGRATGSFAGDTVQAEDTSYYHGIPVYHIYLPILRR